MRNCSLTGRCLYIPVEIAAPILKVARGGSVVWGTAVQLEKSWVRFPTDSLEFFTDIILPATLWSWNRLNFWHKRFFFYFGPTAPPLQWAKASSSTTFLDHTQRRTAVGRTPPDEWSARRRDLYLTTHNTHNRQTSMPSLDSNSQSQQTSGCKHTP